MSQAPASGTADAGQVDARPPAPAGAPEYVIGPEDVLIVSVWKNPDLEQESVVLPDGKLALKLLGEVSVVGMTVPALRQYLTTLYREFVPEADVSVVVKEINSFKVYVLGRVAKPGEYRARSQISALQALALAGGFSVYAEVKKIKIFRGRSGQDQILRFNYKDVVEGNAGDVFLQPGDRLVVP